MVRSVARYASFVALAWLLLSPLVAVWGIGVANNPNNPNAITIQGPDPTGNQGYPIATVTAAGTSLDIRGAVQQATFPWQVAGTRTPAQPDDNPLDAVHTEAFNMLWDTSQNKWQFLHSEVDGRRQGGSLSLLNTPSFEQYPSSLTCPQECIASIADSYNTLLAGNLVQSLTCGGTVPLLYRGTNTNNDYDRQRTPVVYQTVQAAAAGSTALWTPAVGKKFRLMRYRVEVTGNATLAAPAVLTIKLLDAAADTNQTSDSFVPGAAVSTQGCQYQSGWIDLGNGLLSAAANNVLNVNLSAALTAGNVRVDAIGTEE